MADAAAGLRALVDGVRLLPHLAAGWHLGAHPHHAARTHAQACRTSADTQCSDHRHQSVKTTERDGPHGYDGGKKVNGRKRHLLVDTIGLLLRVVVHCANVQDRDGARLVLAGLKQRFLRLHHLWADQAYTGPLLDWIKQELGWSVEGVERSPRRGFIVTPDLQFQRVALPAQFELLPRRWVV